MATASPSVVLLVTVREAAVRLSLSIPAIYGLINAGQLERVHVGAGERAVRVTVDSLYRYVAERVAAESEAAAVASAAVGPALAARAEGREL